MLAHPPEEEIGGEGREGGGRRRVVAIK